MLKEAILYKSCERVKLCSYLKIQVLVVSGNFPENGNNVYGVEYYVSLIGVYKSYQPQLKAVCKKGKPWQFI